jgi:prepilin-type processing-associated H-X9-DG protein
MLCFADATNMFISTGISYQWQTGTTFASAQACLCTGGLASNCRHNLGFNLSFMDGHAKWITFASLPDPTQPAGTVFDGITNCHFWYGTDAYP